ncbi:MAG: acyl-CoA synthetase (AMP-forming)/AMP-acid ligase II [Paraglaciecola sp.]|jgi:acyl-CoA synthetase (AMP-forming)/AMP-acid ligase II
MTFTTVPSASQMTQLQQKHQTLVELLQYQSAINADNIVYRILRNGEQAHSSLTFGELDRQAKGIAAALQQTGQPGDTVVLMLFPRLDYISAFFACLYAGKIAVPAYPPANRRRDGAKLDALLEDCQSSHILTSAKEHQRLVATLAKSPYAQKITDLSNLKHQSDDWQPPAITGDSLAFLQYTSGSTGQPKGVMVSHDNLLNNLAHIVHHMGATTQDTVVSWLPPYHDMGLIGTLLSAVYAGLTTVMMEPVAFLQQPFVWLKAISDYKATHSAAPNFAYQLLIDKISDEQLNRLDLSHWRIALCGAEPVRAQTLADFKQLFKSGGFNGDTFYPAYGLAESTLLVTGGGVQ